LSATSETLRLIEETSARLCQMAGDAAAADRGTLLTAAWRAHTADMSAATLRSLARGLPAGISVDQTGLAADCVFSPQVGRIVLNLLLLAADSLPSGGTVRLAGSARDLFLQIDGPNAGWPAGTAACVVDEAEAVVALMAGGSAQMVLTTLLAHAAGVRLSFVMAPSAKGGPAILRLGSA
jgi:histidine phosphotransferase ChpT